MDLEKKIVALKRKSRGGELSSYQQHELELELANAEEALKVFRNAYELEQRISA